MHEIYQVLKQELEQHSAKLIAVSKYQSITAIQKLYEYGQRDFGESRVQELIEKQKELPDDIRWHMIGHVQTNKVKYFASFIHLIHSVDSLKLLKEIQKQAKKNNKIINCLLQVHIAKEEHKYGLTKKEVEQILTESFENISIIGLMGMATNTKDSSIVDKEFSQLYDFFSTLQKSYPSLTQLSMGMSNDYEIALRNNTTMVRIGSLLFG